MVYVFLLLLASCNLRNISFNKLQDMALKYDPRWEEVIPESMELGISCYEYGPGCVSAKEVFTSNITFIMVQFKNEKQACQNARVLEEYCMKNWLFDEVAGEPIAERFVTEAFNAIRP